MKKHSIFCRKFVSSKTGLVENFRQKRFLSRLTLFYSFSTDKMFVAYFYSRIKIRHLSEWTHIRSSRFACRGRLAERRWASWNNRLLLSRRKCRAHCRLRGRIDLSWRCFRLVCSTVHLLRPQIPACTGKWRYFPLTRRCVYVWTWAEASLRAALLIG